MKYSLQLILWNVLWGLVVRRLNNEDISEELLVEEVGWYGDYWGFCPWETLKHADSFAWFI